MPRLPEQFIEDVLSHNDIADVISQYVALRPKGRRLWGLCPFHGEKTPSFSVNTDEQFYYCFGCHAGGNVFSFIQHIEHCDYYEAILRLAERAHLPIPAGAENGGSSSQFQAERSAMYNACTWAARWFHEQLISSTGKEAYAYLRQRGLGLRTIKRFGLGFAPDGWHNIASALQSHGVGEKELLQTALLMQKDGRTYDAFRNRIIFPILDTRQRVVGFGGRVMDGSQPKYLNSPDTPIYNKRKNLYGLHMLRGQQNIPQIVLTEGYMDVISLHQVGVATAVASLGTALTPEQAALIGRYSKEVVLAYDGDEAGIKASQRALPILQEKGLHARVMTIPDAMDPDDMARKYPLEQIQEWIEQASEATDYRLAALRRGKNLSDPQQRMQYVQTVCREVIAPMESAIERGVVIGQLHLETGISEVDIRAEVERLLQNTMGRENPSGRDLVMHSSENIRQNKPGDADGISTEDAARSAWEKTVLSLAVHEKAAYGEIRSVMEEVGYLNPLHARAAAFLEEHATDAIPKVLHLAEEDVRSLLGELLTKEFPASSRDQILTDCLRAIQADQCEREIKKLTGLLPALPAEERQQCKLALKKQYEKLQTLK